MIFLRGKALKSVWFMSAVVCAFALEMPAETGRIAGVLADPSGAVIERGKIEILHLDSGLIRAAETDRRGRYVFDGVPAGRYRISAFSDGFEKSERNGILVAAGRETAVAFVLNIQGNRTVIEVAGSLATLDSAALVPQRSRISDAASLLNGTPGADVYGSGGLSSLPAIHGLADERVNVLVDGMAIESVCGNHMNPPMSYIDPYHVASLNVMAGITPVSRGGDSIAGTISVDRAAPEFARGGQRLAIHGGVAGFHRTNGVVNGGNAFLSAATENFRVGYTGSYVNANNYKNGAGSMVKSTFYEAQNHALELAGRHGRHMVTLDLGYQRIPQQGFVNARMDMSGNQAGFANLSYDGAFGWGGLEARVYYQNIRHGMNILRDKIPGMNMPMDTKGATIGYAVQAEMNLSGRDILRVGNEYRRSSLDDWWPPVSSTVGSMGPNTLWNVRNGRRERFGAYAEWETHRGNRWTELLGVRTDVVRMNSDNVDGYNMATTTTGSAAYYADAREFNARDHRRLDPNFDLTALARYEPRATVAYEFGYARKTRSPSLYERYLWVKRSAMSANMNGWFGDGNGYTGNLDLRPEVAHTFSATAGWRGAAKEGWELKITPYYTRVQDYVDVDRCPVIVDGSNGCTAARFSATSGFVTLQFANHAARLYGVDVSGRAPLGGNLLSRSTPCWATCAERTSTRAAISTASCRSTGN